MSRRCSVGMVLLLGVTCLPVGVRACGGYGSLDCQPLAELVQQAGTLALDDQERSPDAAGLVGALRFHGQAAVDALITHRSNWGTRDGEVNEPAALKRLDDLIDRVAGQRHATSSKLFWHTSMESAKDEARKTGRPILSLRLLGRLDEDFSCANSRFFRTTLYPDPAIAKQLRGQFVLHWSPVREVPKVTIDLGNGRKLQRPLTGNSVHLVLDQQARPIDAMPGLISRVEFSHWLNDATELWQKVHAEDAPERAAIVADFHRRQAQQARDRCPMAIKSTQTVAELDPTDRRWNDAANAFQGRGLSAQAQTLVAQLGPAEAAMPLAITKSFVETPLLRLVRRLDQNIARDTAFNLFALKPKIDDWLAESAEAEALTYESLTNQIYAEVFLMPLNDPWLGLSPNDQFVALPNAGRVQPENTEPARLKQLLSGLNFRKE